MESDVKKHPNVGPFSHRLTTRLPVLGSGMNLLFSGWWYTLPYSKLNSHSGDNGSCHLVLATRRPPMSKFPCGCEGVGVYNASGN
ncbi:hypothetical protein M5689_022989 [Euphorbia peplus]|nr:hypothetical protein M5689_022989 [Euphorbia peplus]